MLIILQPLDSRKPECIQIAYSSARLDTFQSGCVLSQFLNNYIRSVLFIYKFL